MYTYRNTQSSDASASSSLLDRISPSRPSLLARILPTTQTATSPSPPPVSSSSAFPLAQRLSLPEDPAIRQNSEGSIERHIAHSEKQVAQNTDSLYQRETSRETRLQGHTHTRSVSTVDSLASTPPPRVKAEETENAQDMPLASDAAVNQLLASVLDMDMVVNKPPTPSVCGPADQPPLRTAHRSGPAWGKVMLEECRRLLLPQIVRNTERRKPGVERELIERHARAVLTDEDCGEFMQFAREVGTQMALDRRRTPLQSGTGTNGTNTNGKRARDPEEVVDSVARGMKARRLESPVAGSSQMHVETRRFSPPRAGPSATVQDAMPSSPTSKIPTGPRAMLKDAAVRAMEEYLAGVSKPAPSVMPSARVADNRELSRPDPSVPERRSNDRNVAMDVDNLKNAASSRFGPPPRRMEPVREIFRTNSGASHQAPIGNSSSSRITVDRGSNDQLRSGSTATQMVPSNDFTSTLRHTSPHRLQVATSSTPPTGLHRRKSEPKTPVLVSSAPIDHPAPVSSDSVPVKVEAPSASAPPPPHICLPALWCVKAGGQKPGIMEITFDVKSEALAAVQRWAERKKSFNAQSLHMRIHLLCLPIAAVVEVKQKSKPLETPEEATAAMCSIRTAWPQKGTLIVEVNPESDVANTWLPASLGPNDGPLDISSSIRAGVNTLRLIQLRDMADRVFVVQAAVPPDEEVDRCTTLGLELHDWARLITKCTSRQSSTACATPPVDVPTLGLVRQSTA